MKTNRWIVLLLLAVSAPGLVQRSPTPSEIQALAEEAYVFSFPLLETYRTLYSRSIDQTGRAFGTPVNRLNHSRALADPNARLVVRPNNDTLYSTAWLDLRAQPMVISMPPVPGRRYWSLQLIDAFTHNIAIFSIRNEPSTGARYLVTGPSWKGTPPPGIDQTVRSETQFVLAAIRLGVSGVDDVAAAAAIQDTIALTPLGSVAGSSTAMPLQFPPYDAEQAKSEGFVPYVNFVLGQLAIHPSEVDLIDHLSPIGIGPNRPFDAAALDASTRAATRRGIAAALEKITADSSSGVVRRGSWTVADAAYGNRERMQGQYLARSRAAKRGLFGLDKEEALYLHANMDADGKTLDASRFSYILRFSAADAPPAKAFWSVTMYDVDGFLVANERKRYSIGDRTPDLVKGEDGSLTIWVGTQPPDGGRNANWLPAPAARFSVSLRLYVPDTGADAYVPPPLQQVR